MASTTTTDPAKGTPEPKSTTTAANQLAAANAPLDINIDEADTHTAGVETLDIETEKLTARRVDAALHFLHQSEDIGAEEGNDEVVDEKRLVRKIDFILMPLMFSAYVFQFMDKSLINYANVMGLSTDTHMTAADFSYLATFFYVTFAVFQPVHAVIVQKVPVGKYLAINVTLWGVVISCHSACKTFGALITVRLLLGIFEAAVAPCLILITSMWYKRSEQPLRIATWYLGVGFGIMIGALASFGFQFYTTGRTFKSWQIMYLIFGLCTIVIGGLIAVFMPDSPMTARRLTRKEKVMAIERLRANQTGISNTTFKHEQMWETLKDYRTWLIAAIIIAGNVPTGATGAYASTLIKGFGYDSKQSALLNIPSGAIQAIAVVAASWFAGATNNRAWGIVLLLAPGILGGGLMAFLPAGAKGGKLAGIYLCGIFGPNLSIMYAWAAANYAGHTKKIVINAVILMAYGAANIIGSLTFTGQTAPDYIPAKAAIMATTSVAVLLTIILRYCYVWENKRRNNLAASGAIQHQRDQEFFDLTDGQNLEFRVDVTVVKSYVSTKMRP